MVKLFGNVYRGKRILVTGHTGFKGSWLCLWLQQLGADVVGFSKDIPTSPNHHELLQTPLKEEFFGDVASLSELKNVLKSGPFDLVIHLAAQSIVRYSYVHPNETFSTNVMGTVNVLDLCRAMEELKGAIIVTSDKCYENREDNRAFVETDPLGGRDPYSSSKACAELVSQAYQKSFFSSGPIITTARAGNVVGGGDWSSDRLIPDAVVAASKGQTIHLRYPDAIRPWQHVLESVSGYLLLGQKILMSDKEVTGAWNFGSTKTEDYSVSQVIKRAQDYWSEISYSVQSTPDFHEASYLRLDSTKTQDYLEWLPVWDVHQTIEKAIKWYRAYYEQGTINSLEDLEDYIETATKLNRVWTR